MPPAIGSTSSVKLRCCSLRCAWSRRSNTSSAPVLQRSALRLLQSLRRIGFYDCWANGAEVRSFVAQVPRSEEHTSELQSLMRISYAVFCLNKKINDPTNTGINNVLSEPNNI